MHDEPIFRIRFHGRGGQGIKTASRILGSAFFQEGFEVQDAPLYGAERRGAPIFAYVRAAHRAINERGVITHPDLVVVADDTLMSVPAAGVLKGLGPDSVLLIHSREPVDVWRGRIRVEGPILILPAVSRAVDEGVALWHIGAVCAGAAARLVGSVSRGSLEAAIRSELEQQGEAVVATNLAGALKAFDLMEPHAGCVQPTSVAAPDGWERPAWLAVPFDEARVSAPAVHEGATSVEVRTGLWRTLRPVIDYDRCNRCAWICSTYCPDSAISVDEQGYPRIDLDHCKGCMICVAQCPAHAIESVAEHAAQVEGQEEADA